MWTRRSILKRPRAMAGATNRNNRPIPSSESPVAIVVLTGAAPSSHPVDRLFIIGPSFNSLRSKTKPGTDSMAEQPAKIRDVAWFELFSWLMLARSVRIALMARVLLLGALGLILTALGWWVIRRGDSNLVCKVPDLALG